MLIFIAEKSVIITALLCFLLTFFLIKRIKSLDSEVRRSCGRFFAEMPIRQRQRLFFSGRPVKLVFFATAVVFAAVIFCRMLQSTAPLIALPISVVLSFALTAVIFETVPMLSALLRRLICVNNISLNVILSTEVLLLSGFVLDLSICEKPDTVHFIMAVLCLVFCYSGLVYALLTILREALNKESRLTLGNIWKSAVLTIVLFIFDLSLMSGYCFAFDKAALTGTVNSFLDVLYYTVITFATVGYGDIAPVSTAARAVSCLTVLTSILCITVLLSEISGLKKADKQQ